MKELMPMVCILLSMSACENDPTKPNSDEIERFCLSNAYLALSPHYRKYEQALQNSFEVSYSYSKLPGLGIMARVDGLNPPYEKLQSSCIAELERAADDRDIRRLNPSK